MTRDESCVLDMRERFLSITSICVSLGVSARTRSARD
jgi:hypothetical protein